MTRYDPAWLDREYNNRARIPEHPQIFERWRRASALARETGPCALDLRYGDVPNETLDVFPAARDRAPVLVFIHGGYWRALDKSDQSFVAPSFVADGAMVVVPNYALCPAVTIETIALQMVKALAWTLAPCRAVRRRPAAHRRRRPFGRRAPGGDAAVLRLASGRWRDLPARLVRGALPISGLFDLEPLRQTPFLQDDLRLTPSAVQQLSPAGSQRRGRHAVRRGRCRRERRVPAPERG